MDNLFKKFTELDNRYASYRHFFARKFGLYYKLLYICTNITNTSTSQTRKNHGKDRPQDRPPASVQAQFPAPVLHIRRNMPLSDRGKLLHLAGLLVGSVGRDGMGPATASARCPAEARLRRGVRLPLNPQKINTMKTRIVCLILALGTATMAAAAEPLKITITGLRSRTG